MNRHTLLIICGLIVVLLIPSSFFIYSENEKSKKEKIQEETIQKQRKEINDQFDLSIIELKKATQKHAVLVTELSFLTEKMKNLLLKSRHVNSQQKEAPMRAALITLDSVQSLNQEKRKLDEKLFTSKMRINTLQFQANSLRRSLLGLN
jgi:citrate synthase